MAIINVPRPPKTAHNPRRPVTSLLKAQIEHLREAERRLPLRYRTETYVNAIRTEGEAANYIREVTQAVHLAHADAGRARRTRDRKLEIAARGDKRPPRKRGSKGKSKGKGGDAKRGRKK